MKYKGCGEIYHQTMGIGSLTVACGRFQFPFGFGRFYCEKCKKIKRLGEKK